MTKFTCIPLPNQHYNNAYGHFVTVIEVVHIASLSCVMGVNSSISPVGTVSTDFSLREGGNDYA